MNITIIVPYHGEKAYLKDCLLSLSEQTYKDFEVVLVASDSEVPQDVIDIYSGKLTIKSFTTDKANVSVARNIGLANAEGKYVMFLDCDDYIDRDFLSRLHELALNGNCEITFGRIKFTYYKRSIFLEQQAAESADDESSCEESEYNEEENVRVYDFGILAQDSIDTIRNKKVEGANKYLIMKRKNMQAITVLGCLYLKSFLDENEIRFNEEMTNMADIPFICKVLSCIKFADGDKEAVYVKRIHNDPIHLPSLNQSIGKNDFAYKIAAYTDAVKNITGESATRVAIDKKLISYFATNVVPEIRKNNEKVWRKKNMPVIRDLISEIDAGVIAELDSYKRKLVKALLNNNLKKLCSLAGRRNTRNWIRRIIKSPRSLRVIKDIMYRHVYAKKPVKDNLVLFESFFGKSYSDSPKYIFEKLNEMYPGKYECVWILDKKTKLPYPAKQIRRCSLKYFKYLATSKYIVFNSRQPKQFIKRKGNVFLETWHGTPLKKLVFDMEEVVSATPMYKRDFYIQSRSWDYLVAANGFSEEVFKSAFAYDKPMLKFGYPRNDILHAENKERIASDIKKRIGIPDNKKVILYAPTWRDDDYYGPGRYKFSLKLDLNMLKEKLGDEYVVMLRTHYFIADSIDVTGLEDFVYNMSKYDDIAELYLISDILITDYSSVFFDYANLKRPMLFFTYDLDKYRDVLRGFYIDMEKELPGPLVFSTEEIIDAIQNIDDVNAKYAGIYDEFYERFCGWEDGHASENCIKEVFK